MTGLLKKIMVKFFGLILLSLILSMSVAHAGVTHAESNMVTAARVWPAQDYTRITLESGNPIVYKMSVLKNPERVVVDIENIELNPVLKSLSDKILASDPYITQVRVAKFKPGTVRLVVDLKTEVKPTMLTLLPAGDYKHRLVLDIYPAKDPLMSMLAERSGTAVSANSKELAASASSQPVSSTESVTLQAPPSQPQSATQQVQMTPPVVTTVEEVKSAEVNKQVQATSVDKAKTEENLPIATDDTNEKNAIASQVDGNGLRKITIAIDAGHGGEDPGAAGANGSREKDITLMVAKKLKAKIDAEPGMRGVLTRDGDYFIPLHGRVVKARKLQADLFISIHADAFTNQAAQGSSVFALSEKGATSASARYLAKKENESDLIGGVSLNVKDPVLARTLLDLSQTATINDSLKLGKAVLGHIGEINKLHKNHVEQAGFAVLKSPDIPSILVETAFISNPDEERRLGDEAYQDKLVTSIVDGIRKYFSTNPALAKTKVALE